MAGRRLPGRLSLRLDALYCLVVAVLLLALVAPLSGALSASPPVLVAGGLVVAAWSGLLAIVSRRDRLEGWLRTVLTVNIIGTLALGVLALTRPWDALSLLLVLVAAEVAAFAISQGVALRASTR